MRGFKNPNLTVKKKVASTYTERVTESVCLCLREREREIVVLSGWRERIAGSEISEN